MKVKFFNGISKKINTCFNYLKLNQETRPAIGITLLEGILGVQKTGWLNPFLRSAWDQQSLPKVLGLNLSEEGEGEEQVWKYFGILLWSNHQ